MKAKTRYGLAFFSIAAVLSVVAFSSGLASWFARAGGMTFSGEATVREEKQLDGTLASNSRDSIDYQKPWRMHLMDPSRLPGPTR